MAGYVVNLSKSKVQSKWRLTVNTTDTSFDLTNGGVLKGGRLVVITGVATGVFAFVAGQGAAPAAVTAPTGVPDATGYAFSLNVGDVIQLTVKPEDPPITHLRGITTASAKDILVTVFDY